MKKERIAVLGGGVGGLSAAYWLSQPEFRDRYEITVYQMGWRLGGKGASGRNPDYSQRSEEHGMHIWFGFYENAFRTIRGAYKECGGNGRYKDWTDAFHPATEGSVADYFNGQWSWWHSYFRREPGTTPGDGTPLPTLEEYFRRAILWLSDAIDRRPDLRERLKTPEKAVSVHGGFWGRIKVATGRLISRFLRRGALSLIRIPTHLHNVLLVIESLPFGLGNEFKGFRQEVLKELVFFADSLKIFRDEAVDLLDNDPDLRRILMILDLGVACLRGAIIDDVLNTGLDALDDVEFLAWLRKHGAYYYDIEGTERASPYLRGLYDIPFSFGQGDTRKPRMGAGTALRCFARLSLGYKDAYLFKMQAGMGEIVFTPLYLALKKRGVKFEFFHKVANLGVNAAGDAIETIEIDRQANLRPGVEYDPLVEIGQGSGFYCWPDRPKEEFLEPGQMPAPGAPDFESLWNTTAVEKRVLTYGAAGPDGFDRVIVNISLAGLKQVARELIAAKTEWKNMVEQVLTVRTQAVQLWLRKTHAELGWNPPGLKEPALVDAFANPINSWMDQSVLLDTEQWPAADAPKAIAYFCGPMLDDSSPEPLPADGADYPRREQEKVRAMAIDWVAEHAPLIWPRAVLPDGTFDWSQTFAPAGKTAAEPIDLQYVRANINPSERYVLSVEGSTKYRLKPGDSKFGNLYLTGDWTRTGLNAGCVEAAAMSGVQAARAICGKPEMVPGETDF